MDVDPFWSALEAIDQTPAPPGQPGPVLLREGLLRLIGATLLAHLTDDPPDLVLALAQAPLDAETLKQLRCLGITTALWFCEDFRVLPAGQKLAPLYDTIFHLQPDEYSEPLREAGAFAVPLPMGFDPSLHSPVELNAEQRERYGSEISFLGAGYHNRVQFLPCLADLGLRIYGTEWPHTKPFPDLMPEPNVRQSPGDSNLIFNATRVNLNLHSSPWCDGVNPVGDYLNPRTFELAGARAFQLVDHRRYLAQSFRPGLEVETFRDLDECRKKISYYLDHEDERREIAAAAHATALANHTYRHRMESAVDSLRAAPAPLVPRRRSGQTVESVLEDATADPLLARVLERLCPERLIDCGAITEAIALGEGPLSRTEKLLIFMREAFSEIRVLNEDGHVA